MHDLYSPTFLCAHYGPASERVVHHQLGFVVPFRADRAALAVSAAADETWSREAVCTRLARAGQLLAEIVQYGCVHN